MHWQQDKKSQVITGKRSSDRLQKESKQIGPKWCMKGEKRTDKI